MSIEIMESGLKGEKGYVREMTECDWKQDEYGIFSTSCGNSFEVTEGNSIEESKFKFCIYCGREIVEK